MTVRGHHPASGEPSHPHPFRTGYWIIAALLLALTVSATPFIDRQLHLEAERDWLFQRLAASATNPTRAGEARLVVIRDDDYWLGPLHHRVPTDRAYLARVVSKAAEAGASVIAVDFDLRTPLPDRPAKLGDYAAVDPFPGYRTETDELVRAIDAAAVDHKIVLAKTIAGPVDGPFRLQTDAYEPYGICTRLTGDGRWDNPGTPEFPIAPEAARNISCGYIALMEDARRIPPPARIVGQASRLDAFALAIVRARFPAAVPSLSGRPYYGTYIEGDVSNDKNLSVSAHDLLAGDPRAREVIRGWPAIIVAGWHRTAFNAGPLVDTHPTPVGDVSGGLIHENIVEAVMNHRIYPGLGGGGLAALEWVTGALAALLFAAVRGLWAKIAAVTAAMGLLFVAQWLILELFGAFFDAFVPVFALGLHAVVDRLVGEPDFHAAKGGWRALSRRLAAVVRA